MIAAELFIDPQIGAETAAKLKEAVRWIADDRARVVLMVTPTAGLQHRGMIFDFPGEEPSVEADEKSFDDVLERWCEAIECPFPIAVLRDEAELPMSRFAIAAFDDQGRLVLETSTSLDVTELVYAVRNVLARPGY